MSVIVRLKAVFGHKVSCRCCRKNCSKKTIHKEHKRRRERILHRCANTKWQLLFCIYSKALTNKPFIKQRKRKKRKEVNKNKKQKQRAHLRNLPLFSGRCPRRRSFSQLSVRAMNFAISISRTVIVLILGCASAHFSSHRREQSTCPRRRNAIPSRAQALGQKQRAIRSVRLLPDTELFTNGPSRGRAK